VTKFLPSYAGLQFAKEVHNILAAQRPPQNSVTVLGGAKFETKRPLIEKLLATYSKMLLGGALGNDVIKARGLPVGSSLVSEEPVPVAIASSDKIATAVDAVLKEEGSAERTSLIVDTQDKEIIVDIGPGTATAWADKVSAAPFVLWNGTLGICEQGFTAGTDAIAKAISQSGVRALIGGGDTVAAISKFKFDPNKVFVSTGGGSMLELLVAGTLPAIDALKV
jgi:phosphoglycerate kinase